MVDYIVFDKLTTQWLNINQNTGKMLYPRFCAYIFIAEILNKLRCMLHKREPI